MGIENDWAGQSQDELLAELESIERAIARSRTFHYCTDSTGRVRAKVSAELLALAEREHLIAGELRRRRRPTLVA